MTRLISFALTTPQFLAGTKTVTRRMGWEFALRGDEYTAVEKGQGIPKGGKVKRLGMIRLVDVRRERLNSMLMDQSYGRTEVKLEGFPDMTPEEFVEFFCKANRGCYPNKVITRMEFVRIT